MKYGFFCLCWLLVPGLPAQTLPYTFSAEQGLYQPLANATSINNGEVWDDLDIDVPLGFNFKLLGQTISSFNMYGDLSLNNLITQIDPGPVLLSYGDDLIDRGYYTGNSQSPISYKLEGTSGSHIFKIEWANAGYYNDENNTDFTNTQLWLFEGSNNIEMHFGPTHVINPVVFFDFTGPLIGFLHKYSLTQEYIDYMWYLQGPVNNPVVKVIDANYIDTLTQTLLGAPGDGLIYRFASTVVGVDDPQAFTSQLTAFPSIVSDVVTLALASNISGMENDLRYEITDQLGRKLRSAPFTGPAMQIDVSALSKGLYFLSLRSSGHLLATKIVVKR
ncbi:MAG: T9SS type A sorting domain-containing protein [Saprospiraceae bacterium]